MKFMIDTFCEVLKSSKRILVFGHKNPDGDSFGSMLAIAELLQLNLKKSVVCAYDGNVPHYLDLFPNKDKVQYYDKISDSVCFDTVIVVDCATEQQMGMCSKFIKTNTQVIHFDHHLNSFYLSKIRFVNENMASTGQIIFHFLKELDWMYNIDILNLLALTLITDTGRFKFVSNPQVFIDMADMINLGIRVNDLMNLINRYPYKTVLVESDSVVKSEFYFKRKLVIATIPHLKYKYLDGRGDNVLNLLSSIIGVEFIVLLKEQRINQIGISFRSLNVPINDIAEHFGGGGHACAAGAIVHDTLDNVKQSVIEIFRKKVKL